jgi:hypothetical protein
MRLEEGERMKGIRRRKLNKREGKKIKWEEGKDKSGG